MNFSSTLIKAISMIAVLSAVSACSHKQAKTETNDSKINGYDVSPIKESDILSSDKTNALGLQSVHFPYNDIALDKENRSILMQDVKILKTNSSVSIQIEGHCDQRGGSQYNLALGEKRANAVRKFLQGNGINRDRLTTISMGKEKPLDAAETEEAYAKNRRANLVITSK